MPRIFMSYRRDDSRAISGRIYDRLVESFGEENIFKDVDRIPPGSTFADVLEAELAKCNVLLIIIGQKWVNITDKAGQRRLEDPHDFVRIEVEKGLNHSGMLVIPVLVDEASVPSPLELPDSLDKISSLQVVQIRHDPDFHRDMNRLIDFLKVLEEREAAVQSQEQRTARGNLRRVLFGIGLAAALMMVGFAVLVANGIINIGGEVNATFDPEGTANARLQTLIASTQNAGLSTPNPTEQEAIVLTLMATLATNESPIPLDTPTPTVNGSATAQASMTEAALATQQHQATQNAEATNNALETQNAPTNTPRPSPTMTATATQTPVPTTDLTGTFMAQASLRANAQATLTAWAQETQAVNRIATLYAAMTQTIQAEKLLNLQTTIAARMTQTAEAFTPTPSSSRSDPNNDVTLFQQGFTDQRIPEAADYVTASIVNENDNPVLRLVNTSTTLFGGSGLGMGYYTDHAISARIKIIRGNLTGPDWYLNSRSVLGNYGMWANAGCCVGISRTYNGVYEVLKTDSYAWRNNIWYTIKMEIAGGHISVYVNGRLISDTVDDTLSGGYPYFNLPPGVMLYIDDVIVTSLRQ